MLVGFGFSLDWLVLGFRQLKKHVHQGGDAGGIGEFVSHGGLKRGIGFLLGECLFFKSAECAAKKKQNLPGMSATIFHKFRSMASISVVGLDSSNDDDVKKMLSSSTSSSSKRYSSSVHPKYLISDEERQSLTATSTLKHVETIDLQQLEGPCRPQALEKLKKACKFDGYFEVINHGVGERLMGEMMRVAEEFFEMPVEDRAYLYSNDYRKRTRVSTSFNYDKEEVLHWRDYLRHPCYPLQDYIHSWPTKPSSYKKIAAEYATATRTLTLKLLQAISESLGLDKDYIATALGKQNQTLQINYYPPCPHPDLTLALGAHTDPNCLTLVQHDGVPGLQVLKDGAWLDVPSIHGAFFVNIGDQLQVISNGEYKSLVHRAITNSRNRRISIPCFYGPSLDAMIEAAPALVDLNPLGALYLPFTYQQFLDHFYSQRLVTNTLAHFQVTSSVHKES